MRWRRTRLPLRRARSSRAFCFYSGDMDLLLPSAINVLSRIAESVKTIRSALVTLVTRGETSAATKTIRANRFAVSTRPISDLRRATRIRVSGRQRRSRIGNDCTFDYGKAVFRGIRKRVRSSDGGCTADRGRSRWDQLARGSSWPGHVALEIQMIDVKPARRNVLGFRKADIEMISLDTRSHRMQHVASGAARRSEHGQVRRPS